MHRSHAAVRVLAAAGAVALVGVGAPAHAATEYDGSATALEIEGLQLELFPELPEGVGLPPELAEAPRTLVVPDRRVGFAEYEGSDTKVELPDNPLLSVQAVEASSLRDGGKVVSEAGVVGLDLGAGAVRADVIKASCVGDGESIVLSAPQAALETGSPLAGQVELEPGRTNELPGLGQITYNVQDSSADSGSVANIVIALDSNLSLDALRQIPDAARQFEDTLREVVSDLRESSPELERVVPDPEGLTGEPLLGALEDVVTELPADQVPEQLDLNNVAHLSGTVTIASAQCSQAVTAEPAPAPVPEQAEPVAVDRAGPSEPPLADTGSPMGMMGAGLAGLAALAGGGWALLRTRRR